MSIDGDNTLPTALDRGSVGSQEASSAAINILVFHCQQIGILLQARTALPEAVLPVLASFSTASELSLSSLLEVQCLGFGLKLQHHILASMAVALLLFLLTILLSCRAIRLSTLPDEQRQYRLYRLLFVCLACMNFIFLPSVTLGLSALGCTDDREAVRYLNLFPWIACDSVSKADVLPIATAVTILFILFLPITGFCCLLCLRYRSNHLLLGALSPFVSAFRPQMQQFEAMLLLRRLVLAVIIAFVPQSSDLLPLSIFAVIQCSALIQHVWQPYALAFDNYLELGSLYLLLFNFFTGVVVNGSSQVEWIVTIWTVALLVLNVGFAVVALMLFGRHTLTTDSRSPCPKCCRECYSTLRLYLPQRCERSGSRHGLQETLLTSKSSSSIQESQFSD